MNTILVPIDFSKNSNNALNYAIEIAKNGNSKIVLLHAFHIIIGTIENVGQTTRNIQDVMKKQTDKKLKDLCFEIIKSKKMNCEFISKVDLAVDAILETIDDIKADLVVMGTKGASGIKEVLIGSNTATVIEKAKCPVIAVPEGAKFDGIKKITYATDYHESDIDALKNLVEIAKPFNAQISTLHASDEEFTPYNEKVYLNTFKNKVQKKIKYKKISYKLAYGKYLGKVLDEHIKKESPDLLVMSTRHRNMFDKIFGSSVTKRMAYHTKIPLLVFHHKQDATIFI